MLSYILFVGTVKPWEHDLIVLHNWKSWMRGIYVILFPSYVFAFIMYQRENNISMYIILLCKSSLSSLNYLNLVFCNIIRFRRSFLNVTPEIGLGRWRLHHSISYAMGAKPGFSFSIVHLCVSFQGPLLWHLMLGLGEWKYSVGEN